MDLPYVNGSNGGNGNAVGSVANIGLNQEVNDVDILIDRLCLGSSAMPASEFVAIDDNRPTYAEPGEDTLTTEPQAAPSGDSWEAPATMQAIYEDNYLPLLLRPTSLVWSRSVRRLPLVGSVALARARGAGALGELAGPVEAVVEAVEGVGVVVGVVAGVEVSAATVEAEAAAAVAVGAEVVEVAEVEEAVAEEEEEEEVVALCRGVAPVVVSASSSSAVRRPCPLSSSVSGQG
ncbi:unnamed protein product [Closterium sp. NIES-65]|nr:unnamed protein product [Closterium sp. NIES-65]